MKILLCLLLKADNLLYTLISRLAIRVEGGLHPKHRLMRYHDWFTQKVQPDWTVLDIGCGNGALAYDLAKRVKKVIAIDTNSGYIEQAGKKYAASNIEYVLADACQYQPKEKICAAVLSNVLEHIDDRFKLLKGLSGLCGRLLVRVPMIDRDWLTLYKKEMGVEYRLDTTHRLEYTLDEFKREIAAAGWKLGGCDIRFGEIYAVLEKI